MTAKQLVKRHGLEKLIGRKVETVSYGEWPGGVAQIINEELDPAAPEIVFYVRHSEVLSPYEENEFWEIGVFDHEPVRLLR